MNKKLSWLFLLTACFLSTFAQVAVKDEPRHHLVFENNFVRILDVYLKPGDTTLYHLHNTPSVFVMLSKTATSSQLYGQGITSSISEPKQIIYDSLNKPRHHRVWNEDKTWFHVNDLELVSPGPFKNYPPLRHASLKLLNNEMQANLYKLTLAETEFFTLPSSIPGYLLVCLDEATIIFQAGNSSEIRKMKPGHYEWIAENKITFSLDNGGKPAEFLLLQFK
jgi:hypothetical protein